MFTRPTAERSLVETGPREMVQRFGRVFDGNEFTKGASGWNRRGGTTRGVKGLPALGQGAGAGRKGEKTGATGGG